MAEEGRHDGHGKRHTENRNLSIHPRVLIGSEKSADKN